MATFQTASLLNIIEQGQKMESVFVGVLLEAAMKLSRITDANILVVVDTAHGRKWAGRRSLKDEFIEGRLRLGSKDEEIAVDGGVVNADAHFGQELLMGDLAMASSSSADHNPDIAAAKPAVSKPSAAPSTPINFPSASSFKPNPHLAAPLTVKTSPLPNESLNEDPASSSATSASLESAFKDNIGGSFGNFASTSSSMKLVGSQKRKRRASQTSSQEKKLRGESVEAEANHAFLKGLEAAEESANVAAASEANAKQFLDHVAKKYAAEENESSFDGRMQHESPNSDAEVSDLFCHGQNNNEYELKPGTIDKAIVPSHLQETKPAAADVDNYTSAFSPSNDMGVDGSFKRSFSSSRGCGEGNDFDDVEDDGNSSAEALNAAAGSSAFGAGGNFLQEQISRMLRAKMSVEDISFHLKIPPSIVTYWVQVIGAMPQTGVKPHHDHSSEKAKKTSNSHPFAGMVGDQSLALIKTTPGRRSGKLDKQSLKQLIDSNKSIREIADILGVHPTTVYRAMKAYDLSLPGHNNNTSTCTDGNKGNNGAKSMGIQPYVSVEQQQQCRDDSTPAAAPTGQRVRLKRDRLQLLKTLIMGGASVRECATILGVHHTTIYRAMRNLNLDAQATQHHKAAASHASTSASSPGLTAELAAEMAAGSSLLQHFPGFADAAQMRRWSDPTAAVAAAAAANYMGMGSSPFTNVYNQAAFRDLARGGGSATSGLDFLAAASFPQRIASEEDLNEDLIDDDDFEREERRDSSSPPTENRESLENLEMPIAKENNRGSTDNLLPNQSEHIQGEKEEDATQRE